MRNKKLGSRAWESGHSKSSISSIACLHVCYTGRSENMEVGGSKTVNGVRQLHYIPINISVHQPKNRNLRGDTNANDLELREVVGRSIH